MNKTGIFTMLQIPALGKTFPKVCYIFQHRKGGTDWKHSNELNLDMDTWTENMERFVLMVPCLGGYYPCIDVPVLALIGLISRWLQWHTLSFLPDKVADFVSIHIKWKGLFISDPYCPELSFLVMLFTTPVGWLSLSQLTVLSRSQIVV